MPHERGAAARVQAEPPQLRGREPAERLGGRRLREPADALARRANDDPVELARAIGLDQLAAERAQQRPRDRRRAERPQAARLADRRSEQRILREAAQELRVVVVEREHEAQLLDGLVARSPAPARRRPSAASACATSSPITHVKHAVAKQPRGVVREPRREGERVRTTRTKLDLEHAPIMTAAGDTLTE